jgi:hypothetical protein
MRTQRLLAKQKVMCKRKEQGCKEFGSLGNSSVEDFFTIHEKTCGFSEIACDCSQKILRKDIATHNLTCAVNQIVICPFSEFGCSVKVKRGDLNKHIVSSDRDHLIGCVKSSVGISVLTSY